MKKEITQNCVNHPPTSLSGWRENVHNKYARGGARERAHVIEGRAVKHLLTSLPASPLMDLPAFKVLNTIIPQIFFPLSASTPQISEIYQVQISLNFHLWFLPLYLNEWCRQKFPHLIKITGKCKKDYRYRFRHSKLTNREVWISQVVLLGFALNFKSLPPGVIFPISYPATCAASMLLCR